jgi:hypothetical protein
VRAKRSRRPRGPEHTITPQQYELGWQLYSTMHSVQQVMKATGLTRPQLVWLVEIGNDRKGMVCYTKRLSEQVARIRERSQDAAEQVGSSAVKILKSSAEITELAQGIVKTILGIHAQQRVQVVLNKLKSGTPISDRDMASLALPKGVTETLKALRSYATFAETAQAFRVVFDSPHQSRDPLSAMPRGVKLDLSGESVLPAAAALVEELTGSRELGADFLDELLPESKGWTEADIEHFIATGERPDSDYSRGGGDRGTIDAEGTEVDGQEPTEPS